jgi:hypothetical protein
MVKFVNTLDHLDALNIITIFDPRLQATGVSMVISPEIPIFQEPLFTEIP